MPQRNFIPHSSEVSHHHENLGDYYGTPLARNEIAALHQLEETLHCQLIPLSLNQYPSDLFDWINVPETHIPGVIIENGHAIKIITKPTIDYIPTLQPLHPAIGELTHLTEINCFFRLEGITTLSPNERYAVLEIVNNLYFDDTFASTFFTIEDGYVVEIHVEYLTLPYLPESVGLCTRLRKLILQRTHVSNLPESLCSIPSLEEIYINIHQIFSIPPSIGRLINLKHLTLSESEWPNYYDPTDPSIPRPNTDLSIPPSISTLRNLENLDFSSNDISMSLDFLGELVSIKMLSLKHLKFTIMPPFIAHLVNLETLLLSDCPITEIPPWIGQLAHLKELTLDNCPISDLPPQIGLLTQLERLSLYDTHVERLPQEFANLSNLQFINLQTKWEHPHSLSASAEILKSLKNLKKLKLSCYDEVIPTFLLDMPPATEIEFSHSSKSRLDIKEALPSILQKIQAGRALGWIERHHPCLPLWASRIEDECLCTIKNPDNGAVVKENAIRVLQHLKSVNLLSSKIKDGYSLLL